MNNKFKRVLSSILAFVMVISVLTVMNVSTAFAADVTFYGTLSADDSSLTATSYTAETTVNDYFSIMASSNKTVTMDDDSSKTFTTADGTERTITNRIKTGGAGDTSQRSIKVSPTSDGKLYVYAVSSNSSDTRTLNLLDSTGATVDSSDTVAPSTSDNPVYEVIFDVEADETYYVTSASGGINFYYFGLAKTAAATYNTVTISGAPEGYVVGQGTDVITATDTNTYSLAVGTTYTVWANGYTSYSFTVASTTTTVDASSMTASNTYFESFSNGTEGDLEDLYYTYNYTDDLWTIVDQNDGNTGDLYFGFNNATDLTTATVSGTFTPSTANNTWQLLNFKVKDSEGTSATIGIKTIKDTGYQLICGDSTADTGLMHAASTSVDYVLTIDFEAGTASLALNGGTAVKISIGTGYSVLDSVYAHTATSTRNVSMTTPAAEFTYADKTYVYFGVSAENAANYSSFYIVDNSGNKITGSEGDTVYSGVSIDGTDTAVDSLTLQGTGGSDYVVAYIVEGSGDPSDLDIAFE